MKRHVGQECHVGAKGQEVAVCEVDQAKAAVDKRETYRAEREVRTGGQPVERRLREVMQSAMDNRNDDERQAQHAEHLPGGLGPAHDPPPARALGKSPVRRLR